ncbi:MAG: Uma2 family endonuclease [Anaerolineales bacterium]|nr:Uma2 family endonuclease [Anaerolineales bacterium]
MAVDTPVQAQAATTAPRERYRFTRQVYHALIEARVFDEHSRVELVQGDLVTMAAINPRHASAVDRLTNMLAAGVGRHAIVRVQNPFGIGDDSEPEPDVQLLKPNANYYAGRHPGPAEIYLAIEVSPTTVRYDREVKVPLYGTAGVAEMWLRDLNVDALEVYRQPSANGYDSMLRLKPGDHVAPLAFPDLNLEVAALLPPAEPGS